MNDIHALPTTIVPQAWDKVDTTVDNEPPEVLAPHQFERYCEAVRDLIATTGLHVQDFGFTPAEFLVIQDHDRDLTVKLTLRPDRTVDCEFTLDDELTDPSRTVEVAARVARLFNQGQSMREAFLEED